MDYSVHYVPRNDGETDAALVVRRGAHELSFTEAAAWTAIKGWLAPLGEAADDVPFGCVAQYTLPSVVLDADAYTTLFIEALPTRQTLVFPAGSRGSLQLEFPLPGARTFRRLWSISMARITGSRTR